MAIDWNRGNFCALGAIVAFCAGLAIGWFGRPMPVDTEGKHAAEPRSMAPHEETPRAVQMEGQPVGAEKLASKPPNPIPSTDEPAVRQERLLPRSPTTNRLPMADPNVIFQAGKDDGLAAADDGPVQRLLDAVRISCQFDPGYGAQWLNGRVSIGTAAWQGGAIMYDQIAMADGTALMLETHGGTGSNTGEVKVRVAATRTGLHFSSFVPRGDLISTTVFAVLDENQRFIAVMSTHTNGFNHNSSQFHGACDVLY